MGGEGGGGVGVLLPVTLNIVARKLMSAEGVFSFCRVALRGCLSFNSRWFKRQWKELNGEYQNKLKQDVPVDNLYNHFNNLHSAPELSFLSDSHISVINEKYYLEQQKSNHNYLDNPISLDEVEKAAKMLKYKKSPGPDRIRNEMLKTGIFYLKTSICNLFNLILKSGLFP